VAGIRTTVSHVPPRRLSERHMGKSIFRNYELYLFLLPTFLYFVVFHYGPMYGVQIAFKDFRASDGIWGSPWVGFEHFRRFFSSYQFWSLLKNTLGISLYSLIAGFPAPIILALLLNQIPSRGFKRFVQTITYAPNFISTVVIVGMLLVFLSPRGGLVNALIGLFGFESVYFMARPEWFKTIYVLSGIWQGAGFGSIIYLAALSSIDPQLHEAAIVDGATKFQRIRYIDIPGIIPTAVILLILNAGRIMNVGFEKVFLMQTPLNLESSEIISTYVYKVGLVNAQFSFSSAVGLFRALINLVLIVSVNRVARSVGETALW
jgi:putative aldouronate transport system permease protein